jgi:ATP-binding cassette, subfamily B, bacterial PglK
MKSILYYFQIKLLLSENQRKKFNLFVFLTLITMCLEVIGISLVVPIITLLSGSAVNFDKLNIAYLANLSLSQTTFVILSLLIFVTTIKVILTTFFNHIIYKFYKDIRVSLSNKIYSIYLRKPYEYYLSKNSATLIRNIDEVRWFVASVKYLLFLFAECFMVIGIFTFIFIYEPVGATFAVLILGSFGYLIYKKIQSNVNTLGFQKRYHDQFRLMFLQQGFHAIKDIKVKNKENSFIEHFSHHNSKSTNYQFKHEFIQTLPKLFLEWLLVLSVVLLIGIFFTQGKDFSQTLPTLGLFMVAAFRLMPSITRIMNYIQSIKFGEAVIKSIHDEIYQIDKKSIIESRNEKIIFKKSIELKDINFNYNNSNKNILSGVNLNIKFGDSVGILGFSGSGKTTLINIILGLLKSTTGKILIDGKDINTGLQSWQSHIGYVSQSVYLTDDTLKKNIAFGSMKDEDIDPNKIKKALKDSQLEELVLSLNNGLDTKLGEFGERISGGERQRIGIARALYNDPKLLILDESTNSLDSQTEEKILEDVISLNKSMTIIMIAHRLSTLSKCNRILKLSNSNIEEVNVKSNN